LNFGIAEVYWIA